MAILFMLADETPGERPNILIFLGAVLLLIGILGLIGGLIHAVVSSFREPVREEARRKQLELEGRLAAEQIESNRQRAAADRAEEERRAVLAHAERELKKQQALAVPAHDPAQLALAVNRRMLLQGRMGRVMTVQIVGIPEGRLVIHWAVQCDGPDAPRVVGYRDGQKIFSEHAFAGEHPDQIARGRRHLYAFRVEHGSRVIEREDEFCFEFICPTPVQWSRPAALPGAEPPTEAPPSVDQEDEAARQTRLIRERARALTARMGAVGDALREAERELREQNFDQDTIEHILAQLEADLRKEFGK